MAKMWAESVCVSKATSSAAFGSTWETSSSRMTQPRSDIQLFSYAPIRASHSVDDNNKAYKQLGLSSLKKKIEDAVIRAEMFTPTALEVEEARWSKQEEMIRDSNLWDDPARSDRILVKLADVAKVVDSLKDLTFKAEEAKLITELADMNDINCGLFRQAYNASLDVSKFLDHYRMSKLLKEPYDLEGACVIINAGSGGIYPKIWAEQLLSMYAKWAKKQGYKGRVVEKCSSKNGGIKSAMIEFESECAYGYLSGERGVHSLIGSQNGCILLEIKSESENITSVKTNSWRVSTTHWHTLKESRSLIFIPHTFFDQASAVCVDIVPLFLKTTYDLQIDDVDLVVSSSSIDQSGTEPAICIQHIPTGIKVQSSAERSRFANKIKALNRLKAKLLVIAREQGVSSVTSIKRDAIVKLWQKETRRYVSHPFKLVQDVKTGIELSDLDSVLDGNIEPFIEAHINMR